MDLTKQLQSMLERNQSDLTGYAWLSENDRWTELIFCLLQRFVDQDPAVTREAVLLAQRLGLFTAKAMAELSIADSEPRIVLSYILSAHGFSRTAAADAARASRRP